MIKLDKKIGVTVKKKPSKMPQMYLAAFSVLLMEIGHGISTGCSAVAMYDMQTTQSTRPVKPSEDGQTWIGSIMSIGVMAGGLLAGPLAEKFGRKDVLVLNIIPFTAGWVIAYCAWDITTILVGRFLCDAASGIIGVVVPMYCVEISSRSARGMIGSACQGFLVIGHLICVSSRSYIPWQYLSFLGACFATLGFICFWSMPESPRWLLTRGKLNDAIRVMETLHGNNINAEEQCKEIYKDLLNRPKGMLSLTEWLHPTVYKPALISATLYIFQQFSGIMAVFAYSSSIFVTAKDFIDPRKVTIVLAVVQVIATLLSNLLVEKAGRKPLMLISAALLAVSSFGFGEYYYRSIESHEFHTTVSCVPLVSLIFMVIAYSIGYGPLPPLLSAEMTPIRARSIVTGLAFFSRGLFAFIAVKTFNATESLIGTASTFWMYGVITVLGFFFILAFVPETKGKKLEEISLIFDIPKPDIEEFQQFLDMLDFKFVVEVNKV